MPTLVAFDVAAAIVDGEVSAETEPGVAETAVETAGAAAGMGSADSVAVVVVVVVVVVAAAAAIALPG